MNLRIVPEGVGDDHKKEIRNGDDQAEKKTNGSFLPMGCDAERYSNEGKSHAGKRKGKPFVQLRPAGAALPFVCALQLVDRLMAAEKRHRISGCEIVETGAQFFLCCRGHLHIKPQANGGADESNKGQRNANARYTHAVGTECD